MNKFIFLDIDGVLNDDESLSVAPHGGHGIDNDHLQQLKQLVDNTGAQIILSSDWRFNSPDWPFKAPWERKAMDKTWAYLLKRLNDWGLSISDFVPHRCILRGNEISMFLFNKMPCQYVILDDLPEEEFTNHLPHLVHTNPAIGLTWHDIWEAQEKMKLIATEVTI